MSKKNHKKEAIRLPEEKDPVILFTEEAFKKCTYYTQIADKEVGWLALVNKTDDTYTIYDTIMIKQKVSAVTTDLDEGGLVDAAMEIIQERPEVYEDIRCWCHSHVDMGVTPSGTDVSTFKQLYGQSNYFIRMIFNKSGEVNIDLADVEGGWLYYGLSYGIVIDQDMYEVCEKEMKECVTEEKYTYKAASGRGYASWYDKHNKDYTSKNTKKQEDTALEEYYEFLNGKGYEEVETEVYDYGDYDGFFYFKHDNGASLQHFEDVLEDDDILYVAGLDPLKAGFEEDIDSYFAIKYGAGNDVLEYVREEEYFDLHMSCYIYVISTGEGDSV